MDLVLILGIVLILISIAHFVGVIRIVGGATKAAISVGRFLAISGPITLILLIIGILLLLLYYGYI